MQLGLVCGEKQLPFSSLRGCVSVQRIGVVLAVIGYFVVQN